jgi:ribosomal protein L40E
MSKLICNHCQTENPPDAASCSRCGRSLTPVAPLFCTNCQAENPPNLTYCGRCGALLVDRLGMAGADENDDLDNLTDWLREALSGEVIPDPASDETSLTAWLEKELTGESETDDQDSSAKTGENGLTGWLKANLPEEEEDAADNSTAAHSAGTGLTAWLGRELAGETATDDDASPAEREEGGLTGWLNAALTEASEGRAAATEADQPPDADEPPLTDWLRASIFDDAGDEAAEADEDDDALSTTGPLPSWLVDLAPHDTNMLSLSAEEIDAAGEGFTDSLDWLGIVPSAEASPSGEQETEADFAAAGADHEIADWLEGAPGDDEPAAEDESADEEPDLSLADWLETDWVNELGDLDTISEAPEGELSLTDWLDTAWSAEAPLAGSEAAAGEDLAESAAETDSEEPDQLPLAKAALETEEETDDTADWLAAISLDEPEEDTADAPDLAEVAEEALPDWLSAVKVDEDSEVPLTGPLPDWLVDMAPTDTTVLDASGDELDLNQGLDWLQAAGDDEGGDQAVDELAADTDEAADDWPGEGDDESLTPPELTAQPEDSADDLAAWTAADLADEMPSLDMDSLAAADDQESGFTAWLEAFADDVLEPEAETPPAADVIPAEEDVLPPWLSEAAGADATDADEVAKWLAGEETGLWADEPPPELADLAELAGAEPPAEAQSEEPLPDWLLDVPDAVTADVVVEELPADISDDDLPDWLRDDDEAVAAEIVDRELPADVMLPAAREWDEVLGEAPADAELLDLGELPPPEKSVAAPLPSLEAIPDWMQALKPAELAAEELPLPVDEPPVATGPLAGLRGVVGIEPIIAQPHKARFTPPALVSPEQQLRVALLRRLTDEEPAPRAAADARRPGAPSAGYRLLLSALLLLAVVAGLLMPRLPVGSELLQPEAPDAPPAVLDFQAAVQAVAGRPVLVAFEYTPALAGELDLQAALLLRQIASNGSPIITVSQSAAGLAKANELTAALPDLDRANIGYLPGEALGLRYLTACIRSEQTCRTIYGRDLGTDLDQIAMIVLITGERDNLVNWIEQVGVQLDLPMVAITTQALGPVAAPYLVTTQLDGALAGLPDAAAYEQLLGQLDGPALQNWQSVTLARWLALALLIAGNGWYGLTHLLNRRRKKGRST